MKKKNKAGFREMVARDKKNMLPLNFAMSYIVVPLYVVFAFLLIVLFSGMLNSGRVPGGLVCLGLAALMTIALLVGMILVKKKAIKTELDRYDLDTSGLESKEEWDFSVNELSVRFNRHGMNVNGKLFYYNHIRKVVITDNSYKRVSIYLVFAANEKDAILLPLSAETLKMMEDFGIEPDNREDLDYILSHKEEAFKEIYKKGKLAVKSK